MTRAHQRSLRDHNLCLVFSHIAGAEDDQALSRADLAAVTGLTKATVSSLVTSLIAAGLVAELTPAAPQRAGRPAIPLTVAPGTVAALGLEINVDFLGVRAVDLTGATLGEAFEPMNLRQLDPLVACQALVRLAHRLINRLRRQSVRLIGACLALPGIADHPAGPLRLAPNLGWHDLDLHDLMDRAITSLAGATPGRSRTLAAMRALLIDRLSVDNEANLAARTELDHHLDKSFIYVSGEVGIGAAIVVDGQVFTGLHGWAGEIGHIVVDPHGPTCACGANGCLEMYAGKRSLMTAAGLDPEEEVAALLRARDQGDDRARAALDQAAAALGIALANCVNLVDVSRIVLGGSFAPLTEAMRETLAAQLTARVLSSRWVSDDLEIQASSAGSYAATTGGALTVLDRAVVDPSSELWMKIQ